MSKPRLLDLFCGAGGAAVGYARAGFEVVGVDHKPQPHYPFEFYQADALTYPLDGFDVIHASPPCQAYSALRNLGKQSHLKRLDLVASVRDCLQSVGVPYVIENVVGAPLRDPVMLCGSMFNLGVRRHRLFESNVFLMRMPCRHGKVRAVAVYGDHPQNSRNRTINRATTLRHGQEAMGIDWMEWRELTQAIPPAYTAFIGEQLMRVLKASAA